LTSGLVPGPRIFVVGVDPDGTEVARLALGHGDEPSALLAGLGWDVLRAREVRRHPAGRQVLTMTFLVAPSPATPRTDWAGRPTGERSGGPEVNAARPQIRLSHRGDQDTEGAQANQEMADGDAAGSEVVLRHQRVAAYAVVTSSRGFLMTQFSDRTGAEGQWGLPGGGLEDDEAPDRAAVREVWEESGQLIELSELALIATSRWVGLAPGGRLEDYHAVRVIYRASCPEPTEPVVHDVGGTTASAAWLLPADLDLLAMTPGWRSILREVTRLDVRGAGASGVVTAPDETDRPEDHHHDTDADDPARPEP
jgi:8-oxo-dGTP pyrophosphatase MutT (NUDIX family)